MNCFYLGYGVFLCIGVLEGLVFLSVYLFLFKIFKLLKVYLIGMC